MIALFFIGFLFLAPYRVFASNGTGDPLESVPMQREDTEKETESSFEDEEENAEESGKELLSEMKLEEIQKGVDELLEEQSFSFQDMVTLLMKGEKEWNFTSAVQLAGNWLMKSLRAQKGLIVQLVVLILFGSLLQNLSSLLEGGRLSEISFTVLYVVMFALLLRNFQSSSESLQETVKGLVSFMKILTPSYYLAIAAASGGSSALMFYQMVLLLIFFVEKGIVALLLPVVHLYFLMSLVNNLSREEFLSRMTELLETVVSWMQKTAIGILAGLSVLRGLISPALDSFRRTAFGKAASMIPGLGNAVNAVSEMVIGSAVLVRNCFGVTAILVFLAAGLMPTLQFAVSAFSFRLLGALSQPITDPRISDCLSTVGKGYEMLLRTLLMVELLFLITIAILAGSFS